MQIIKAIEKTHDHFTKINLNTKNEKKGDQNKKRDNYSFSFIDQPVFRKFRNMG